MDPLDRIEGKVDRIESKVDDISLRLGSHEHRNYLTFTWYIGTSLTFAGLIVGLVLALV